MSTLELARKIEPTRHRPATAMSATLLQAIVALCFALVVVAAIAYPPAEAPDSAIFSVAGP